MNNDSSLLAENKAHGAAFFIELYLLRLISPDYLNERLTLGVKTEKELIQFGMQPKDVQDEGIESLIHGRKIHYKAIGDGRGKIVVVSKQRENWSPEYFHNADAHYHVSSLDHGTFQGSTIFGTGIISLEDALEVMKREAKLYAGEVQLSPLQLRLRPKPTGDSKRMFLAFVRGFYEQAERLRIEDAEVIKQTLDMISDC